MKKLKVPHISDRRLILVLTLIIGLLVAVTAFLGWRIQLMNKALNGSGDFNEQQETGLAWYPIKSLVSSAVNSIYSLEPATDAVTARVYIPEAKIYLPLTDDARNLVYSHSATTDGSPEQFSFNTKQNLDMWMRNFGDVSCIQRIAGFSIDKNQYDQGGKYSGSVSLADGRKLYFYMNTASCQRPGYNPASMVSLLQQAKSY